MILFSTVRSLRNLRYKKYVTLQQLYHVQLKPVPYIYIYIYIPVFFGKKKKTNLIRQPKKDAPDACYIFFYKS